MTLPAAAWCLLLLLGVSQAPTEEATPPSDQSVPSKSAADEATETRTQEEGTKPRVILYPSRLRSINGHLIEEGEGTIKLLDRSGKTHEFDSSLIYALVRLHDVEEPLPAVVHLQDGRIREGLLEEDSFDHVRLKIHGVDHQFARQDVTLVRLLPSFDEEYERLLRELDESNILAHLSLCRWLISEERLPEAKAELERLLGRENNPTARKMLQKIDARLAVQNAKKQNRDPADDRDIKHDSMPDLVTDSDVNLVRVYEIQVDDPPKLRVPAATVQKLFDGYQGSPLLPQDAEGQIAFTKSDPADIVSVMFALRARELYGEIQVLTEPALLSTFRQRIHDNWLLNRCGSRACHGGPEETAGGFRLHWSYRPDDRVRTSNLLALNRLEFDDGKMLNWSHPKQSLLYQYALPRSEASTPHPEVDGWEPVFTPGGAGQRKAYLNWIEQMMGRHHKDWPVDYTPWTPSEPDTEAVSPPAQGSGSDPGQSR